MAIEFKKLINRSKGVCGFLYLFVHTLLTGILYFVGIMGRSFGVDNIMSSTALGIAIYNTVIFVGIAIALFSRKKAGTGFLKFICILEIVVAGVVDILSIVALVIMIPATPSYVEAVLASYGIYNVDAGNALITAISSIIISSLLIIYLSFSLGFLSCIKKAYSGVARKYTSKVVGVINIIVSVAVVAIAALLVFYWGVISVYDIISIAILALFALSVLLSGIIMIRWANKAKEIMTNPPAASDIPSNTEAATADEEASTIPVIPVVAASNTTDVVIEEAPEVIPEEVPEVIPEEAPEAIPEETPEAIPEEAPEAIPEEAPEAIPEEAPEAIPEETPEAIPEETPEVIPEEALEVIPEEAPEAIPEETPETIPEEVPEVVHKAPVQETPVVKENINATPVILPVATTVAEPDSKEVGYIDYGYSEDTIL